MRRERLNRKVGVQNGMSKEVFGSCTITKLKIHLDRYKNRNGLDGYGSSIDRHHSHYGWVGLKGILYCMALWFYGGGNHPATVIWKGPCRVSSGYTVNMSHTCRTLIVQQREEPLSTISPPCSHQLTKTWVCSYQLCCVIFNEKWDSQGQ